MIKRSIKDFVDDDDIDVTINLNNENILITIIYFAKNVGDNILNISIQRSFLL